MSTSERVEEPFAVNRRTAAPASSRGRQPAYSRKQIVDAVQRWTKKYGSPPASDDWDPARAERQGHVARAERFRSGDWPSARQVRRQFGTFGNAVTAAGLTSGTRRRNKPHLSHSEEILRAIREWTRRYGEPPSQSDWEPARARKTNQLWRVVRFEQGDWPSLVTTRVRYGSLGNAVRLAGLEAPAMWEPLDERVQRQLRNTTALVRELADRPGPGGPGPIADALRAVAAARANGDDGALGAALETLAESALRWSINLRWSPDSQPAVDEPAKTQRAAA